MNDVSHPDFWENIYLEDDAGWDLSCVTPVFKHISNELKKGSVCFIGCGRGYDAVHFAKKGFQVTAVDFAPTAVADLSNLARQESVILTIVQDDIFSLPQAFKSSFDFVIEQTCFCAIDPERRHEYESMVKLILKPHGSLIGLWFPLDKKLEEGGPPWGTTAEEVKSVFSDSWSVEKEEFPKYSIDSRKGREKLIIFQKT